jgi:alkanesulfonate monooxygenase SsuD/methylene tetrahydromethanopterin reductase-like flavin-dependent oxidoreductase (luciferase family)
MARDIESAREAVSARLGVPSYASRLVQQGYPASDIDEVSDRLVNALVAYGDPADVAAKVAEHLAAGADHVVLLPPIGGEFGAAIDQFEELGAAVAELGDVA